MSSEVKLLGAWGSPYSRRVELALKLKGVTYDYIEEEGLYSNKSALLLQSNPVHKKIPVLFHGGKSPIAESLIILEYIDETWTGGHRLLPNDPLERAKARFLMKFLDDKCVPATRMSFRSEGEVRKKHMEECYENLSFLEGELKGKKFFGGESIGIVDIAANFLTVWTWTWTWTPSFGLDEEKHPILASCHVALIMLSTTMRTEEVSVQMHFVERQIWTMVMVAMTGMNVTEKILFGLQYRARHDVTRRLAGTERATISVTALLRRRESNVVLYFSLPFFS